MEKALIDLGRLTILRSYGEVDSLAPSSSSDGLSTPRTRAVVPTCLARHLHHVRSLYAEIAAAALALTICNRLYSFARLRLPQGPDPT